MNYWIIAFFVNWVLNIIAIEFFVFRKLRLVFEVDEARDSKYQAFRRLDTKYIKRMYLFPICHFAILKFVILNVIILLMAACITVVYLGLKDKEECKGWRRRANRVFCAIISRCAVWTFTSTFNITVERPTNVCYKQYLGPTWEADYDGMRCGTVISNHGSAYDSFMHAAC